MLKNEKVKLLLKYAEQYGFNVSKSHILTKNGNVQRDATWRDYIIGITEVKNADGIYERGTHGVFEVTVMGDLIFTITAGSLIHFPVPLLIQNFVKPKYYVYREVANWNDFKTEEDIEKYVKLSADAIEALKLNAKQYDLKKREQKMKKDF
jgi:hypothetical protein